VTPAMLMAPQAIRDMREGFRARRELAKVPQLDQQV
jgi:hypothetical protein